MTLIEFLKQESAKSNPTIPAIVDAGSGESVSYDELWKRVDTFANQLIGHGIQSGDKIMLTLPNSADWIIYCLGIIQAGACVVPVKTSSMPWEIKKLINQTKPVMFIGDAGFINKSLPFDVEEDGKRLAITSRYHLRRNGSKMRVIDLRKQIGQTLNVINERRSGGDELVSITYTYRGVGYPVGVMMNHKNYISGIKAYIKTGELSRNHRFLSVLPFSYSYPFVGCVLVPIATGSSIHLCDSVTQKKLIAMLDDVDVLTGTPSLYSTIVGSPKLKKLDHITHAYCGGSFMSKELFSEFKDSTGVELRQGYGLTESLPATCNSSKENHPATMGKALHGMKVSIVDSSGKEVPVGKKGEIAIKGPSIMRGYWKNEEQTKAIFKNGWLLTGDVGHKDKDGYIHFDGLKKRIVKVGGNMVDLAEVEERIASMDDVKKVSGYGVQDDRWGEVVGVDVEFSDDKCNERILKNRLRKYMSSYKVPKIVRQLN